VYENLRALLTEEEIEEMLDNIVNDPNFGRWTQEMIVHFKQLERVVRKIEPEDLEIPWEF